ncbi:unnamed protein product [Eruca vesicaria subsp. sativa]|uniref:S-protein homolog n=1 Tax=Eruca vesicaria subsp. sativa TaxID=29727 RepID=A0ABC8L262_ERUVS|nr:unnamed protein product [Eruca vesicaria subsp. sativa]
MNFLFNTSFLISLLCFGSSEASICPKNTLVFQNSLIRAQRTLIVNCKSKDNDLGDHYVKFKDPAYNFSFHDNVIFTTQFDCSLYWDQDNLAFHKTFAAYIGAAVYRCGALYVWNARDDAIYLSKDRKPEKFMYDWLVQ